MEGINTSRSPETSVSIEFGEPVQLIPDKERSLTEEAVHSDSGGQKKAEKKSKLKRCLKCLASRKKVYTLSKSSEPY